MTCSCTKSEIIEKEPSIYDDYSIYESQYGYANGKVYGSESDYGSEYGSGHGKNGELQHENGGVGGRTEPSEIGTYQSQNYQQSTLGRTRH
jgi:hypothetical protein